MIGPPYPGVVDDRIVAVDLQIDDRAADSRAADAKEEIVQ
jgi:hypothetical protein